MADPSLFDAIRIPGDVLVALDNRTYHFALQRWHFIVRLLHVLSMALFFGGIVLLDLALIGVRTRLPVGSVLEDGLRIVYLSLGAALVTGTALFFYDPVHVGAHAYFAPKLLLTAMGLANAVAYHRLGGARQLAHARRPPWRSRVTGFVSLGIWTGVMICAALNVEGVPKVFLR